MEPTSAINTAALAAHIATNATIHSYINHVLLVVVGSLLCVIAWFFRGTLFRIEKGLEKKADKETNDSDHIALFAHYHEVRIDDCRPPKCTGQAGDLMVPHQYQSQVRP